MLHTQSFFDYSHLCTHTHADGTVGSPHGIFTPFDFSFSFSRINLCSMNIIVCKRVMLSYDKWKKIFIRYLRLYEAKNKKKMPYRIFLTMCVWITHTGKTTIIVKVLLFSLTIFSRFCPNGTTNNSRKKKWTLHFKLVGIERYCPIHDNKGISFLFIMYTK